MTIVPDCRAWAGLALARDFFAGFFEDSLAVFLDTEERAFRAGQLHVTYEAPLSKIDSYKRDRPELLRVDAYRLLSTRQGQFDEKMRIAPHRHRDGGLRVHREAR